MIFILLCGLVVFNAAGDSVSSQAYGAGFRAFLKEQYATHKQLGYKKARLEMYGYIYNSPEYNAVRCIYTDRSLACPYLTTETNCNEDLNCEHVVPQSLFKEREPMKSDLHHLFPATAIANSARSNYPFENIPTEHVAMWYGRDEVTNTRPKYPRYYSKLSDESAFEPRDAAKGKIARAIAYFFMAYPEYFAELGTVIDGDTLLHWNILYPPTYEDLQEHKRITLVQGNENPFVINHLWLVRAYCDVSSWGCEDFDDAFEPVEEI